MELSGYQINEKIYEGRRTLVYRGIRLSSGLKVVIKLMRSEYPTFNELVQFRNQYAISKNLNLPGVVKSVSLETYKNVYALVMEDTGGISLDKDREHRYPVDLRTGLKVAVQLAEILHGLYQNRVIHKDIKPANILIDPDTKEVKLIDFSIASLLPREAGEIQNPNKLEGTLAYISPEQTGRMNRGIDYRSDFYSLGVTLYELLAGELPFVSDDSMELIHCHLSKQPPPLGKGNRSEIPELVSDIVLKLMAKNAEDRYQSALGLKFDLEKCLRVWQETGSIEPFELGERDISDRFNIPEKLYGRETKVRALLDAFVRVADGKTEMMLVAGFSGIGKTAVISEVHKPIVRARGYFIKGKFDQFQRNIPLSAIVQAFRDLMGQLLAENDAQLQRWKSRILDALGENGQVIIEVIPELERVIGKQPSAPQLSGSAAQNRFNRLFQQFIRVFTTALHPLVIFVDDLQWADGASLKLMELLMEDTSGGYLLLLGAYRDNEVSSAHPLMRTLDEIASEGATLNTITLEPLSEKEVNRLVADTLSCTLETALPLTELVYQKTEGNPFFATQFLKGLHDDGWIEFNAEVGYWQCDMSEVRSLALTSDVVEFMATRLHKLPDDTRDLLKLAACIGNEFDLGTLALVWESSRAEIASCLWGALQEGLILPLDETYKFFQGTNQEEKTEEISVGYKFWHDRVQQAAYYLFPEAEKPACHLKIGRLLWQKTAAAKRENKLFEMANHFNRGVDLIVDRQELDELARLNLLAGQKAKNATAYQAAVDYLERGLKLLRANSWQLGYELTLQLHLEAVESEYLNGNIERSESLAEIVLQQAKDKLDAIKVYETKIQIYITSGQTAQGIDTGLDALAMMGMSLAEINNYSSQTPVLPPIDSVPKLDEAREPYHLAKMRILIAITSAALISRPEILFPVVISQAHLCKLNGYSALAAFSYSWYGGLLCVNPANIESGTQSGQLAMALLERFDARREKSSVYNMVFTFVNPWKKHARESLEALLEGAQSGLDVGDLVYASYCLENYCAYLFLTGTDLVTVSQKQDPYIKLMGKIKNDYAAGNISIWRQLGANFLGESTDVERLSGEHFDEVTAAENWQAFQLGWSLFNLYLAKTMLAYHCQNWFEAIASATLATSYAISVGAWMPIAINNFYYSLALLANWENISSESEREEVLALVESNQNMLHQWARHAAENYQHKWELVEAERQRVLSNKTEAIELYDLAIAGAKANEYIQEEALANELAAKFYLDWGKDKVAAGYMQDAYYCYSRWGAIAKVKDLERRYPQLLTPILERQFMRLTPSASIAAMMSGTISKTTTGTGQLLDLATLMKSSQTLSEDISLDGAIANLMQVARENAGAETVALMLFQDSVLMLRALVRGEDAPQIEPVRVEESLSVPASIINKVKRTLDPLVLDNACNETAFAGEPYIQKHQPQSILCLPLIARGKLIGILYLENNRVARGFTSDRLEVLNLLCSGAAISIENARLYEQSTDYADKLERSLEELQAAQLQLIQSEKMSALGNLVAGVAHEINNPVGFIAGNLEPTLDCVQELFGLIELYERKMPTRDAEIEAQIERMELEFIRDDLLEMISAMQEGTERLAHISTSLRTFSRTDKEHKVPFQLQDGIESTLLILKHRLKANKERPEIKVVRKYGDLPQVKCYPGQLNQVFMNLLANAIDAMDEGNAGRSFGEIKADPNRISITTCLEGERAVVKIADNGTGMPEAVKERIFEQGFTTKAVGKGTGLGMAVSEAMPKAFRLSNCS